MSKVDLKIFQIPFIVLLRWMDYSCVKTAPNTSGQLFTTADLSRCHTQCTNRPLALTTSVCHTDDLDKLSVALPSLFGDWEVITGCGEC